MGFFDFLKLKPKPEIEELANINTGRLGVGSTISSIQSEGQKYFNWLKDYIDIVIDDGAIVSM